MQNQCLTWNWSNQRFLLITNFWTPWEELNSSDGRLFIFKVTKQTESISEAALTCQLLLPPAHPSSSFNLVWLCHFCRTRRYLLLGSLPQPPQRLMKGRELSEHIAAMLPNITSANWKLSFSNHSGRDWTLERAKWKLVRSLWQIFPRNRNGQRYPWKVLQQLLDILLWFTPKSKRHISTVSTVLEWLCMEIHHSTVQK